MVQERIQRACERAGQNPAEVSLVLVTKNVPVEKIHEAFQAGVKDFGENRVQELLAKSPKLPAGIQWHFVGHLQTNKVRSLLGVLGPDGRPPFLHSLDRLALAEEIQRQAEKKGLEMEALLQVNTTGEPTKSGFAPDEVEVAIEKLRRFSRIRLRGLMTIGPLTGDEKVIRASFQKLKLLRDTLQERFPELSGAETAPLHLSMGMSTDFEIAIEEGATIVRIGTAVFGERLAGDT